MINLSIIIPYHNEPYARIKNILFSLDSQVNCDFNQIEILISNNCTNPSNDELRLNEFPNIKDIVKLVYPDIKNSIGMSRQCGVDNAVGKYIMFCDSDDMLYSADVVSNILSIIENEQNNDVIYLMQLIEQQFLFPNGESKIFAIKSNNVQGFNRMIHIHDKLYKREFLINNNIRFCDKLTYNEDGYYNILVNFTANNIIECDMVSYIVKKHDDSVSHTKNGKFEQFVGEQSILSFYFAYQWLNKKLGTLTDGILYDMYRGIYNSYRIISEKYSGNPLYADSEKYTNMITAKCILDFDSTLSHLPKDSPQVIVNYINKILTEYDNNDFNDAISRNYRLWDK